MKIPIKFGLLIAAGVMAWVLLAHQIVADPASPVHSTIGPIFFNVLQFVMIYLGLKAMERERGDRLTFKEAVKTGAFISFVYALTVSLFFAGVVSVVGTRWLAHEPDFGRVPATTLVAKAFVLLFVGAMFLGLIYSTVISFFLAKRQSDSR
jgi:uncharacterized membrane protein